MVSAELLASDFISRAELPLLLERRRSGELQLLMLVLSPCDLDETHFHFPDPVAGPHVLMLNQIQALHPLTETLQDMPEQRTRNARRSALSLVVWTFEFA